MNILIEGLADSEVVYRGICVHCHSVLEDTAKNIGKLTNDKTIAGVTCPVCNALEKVLLRKTNQVNPKPEGLNLLGPNPDNTWYSTGTGRVSSGYTVQNQEGKQKPQSNGNVVYTTKGKTNE